MAERRRRRSSNQREPREIGPLVEGITPGATPAQVLHRKSRHPGLTGWVRRTYRRVKYYIMIATLAVIGLAVVGGALYLMRSGNAPEGPVVEATE